MNPILQHAEQLKNQLPEDLHSEIVESINQDASRIAQRSLTVSGQSHKPTFDQALDGILTHPVWGFAAMAGLFFVVFWLTIAGANVPSSMLNDLLVGQVHPFLKQLFLDWGLPTWFVGITIDGMYLATAWVVAVMLPPMAIFFPMFALLEDFGYLPRVAFNLDRLFAVSGAHGKQALSMMMGFGCNAAGVVATRIIDSPRERLIAILTNNFSICNGRWATLILMSTLFLAQLVPPAFASLVAAISVVGVAVLGIVVALAVSWTLSKTLLKGEASFYTLELPPYRPPQFWRTVYRSMLDRTLSVLWRAVIMAAPAGAVIWLVGNVWVGEQSLASILVAWLEPIGLFMGLNGVILLAYIIAIPANEIIIPTVLMLTVIVSGTAGSGVMMNVDTQQIEQILKQAGGWTVLTGLNLMLFSLLHNPCSTTILTIYHETKSLKWTTLSVIIPLGLGFGVCALVAGLARYL